jgi:translation initiation factor 1A
LCLRPRVPVPVPIVAPARHPSCTVHPGADPLTNRRNPNSNPETEIVRVRLPKKWNNEMFARADLMLGANHIRVRCFDGVTRMGRIKGKIKKRAWIREGDLLIIIPWEFQDEKCDIHFRYRGPQVDWLKKNGYLS